MRIVIGGGVGEGDKAVLAGPIEGISFAETIKKSN